MGRIYKNKRDRVSTGYALVVRVLPDQLPGRFLLKPGPVPGQGGRIPGRPAGSIRVSKLYLGVIMHLEGVEKRINIVII
jgi:hypothetical protein